MSAGGIVAGGVVPVAFPVIVIPQLTRLTNGAKTPLKPAPIPVPAVLKPAPNSPSSVPSFPIGSNGAWIKLENPDENGVKA